MAILLHGVDPTLFNFFSGLLSVVGQSILIFCVHQGYGVILNWHLSKGKQIPASMLGNVPPNFFGAMSKIFLKHPHITLPMMLLLTLFAFADFSDSLARLGIAYVTTLESGKEATVLSLRYENRNTNRLFETAGDPKMARTISLPVDPRITNSDEKFAEVQPNALLVASFVTAIKSVALGESELSTYGGNSGNFQTVDMEWGGVNVSVTTSLDETPLSSIALDIPLNCSSKEMAEFNQWQGTNVTALNELGIRHDERVNAQTAQVPNCTLTGLRPSGIYRSGKDVNEEKEIAYIVEHVYWRSFAGFSSPTDLPIDVQIIQNGIARSNFFLAPSAKRLARDRKNWKEGRTVEGIDGMQWNSDFLEFDSTILASGGFLYLDGPSRRINAYLLVSTTSRCPPPSKVEIKEDTQCVIFSMIACQQFNEDIEPFLDTLEDESSLCYLDEVHIVWGRNFIVDQDLGAVLAGVFGITQPDTWSFTEPKAFFRNVVLGALFALGTVTIMPSNAVVVSPEIDALYVIFMILPPLLAVAVIVPLYCRKNQGKDVPLTSYHMLLWGKEKHHDDRIPLKKGDDFPSNVNNRLVYTRVQQADGSMKGILALGDDPRRQLQDPILYYAMTRKIHGMQNENERNEWIERRVRNGLVPSSAKSGGGNDSEEKDLLTKQVDARLEFLNEEERRYWIASGTSVVSNTPSTKEDSSGDQVHPKIQAMPEQAADHSHTVAAEEHGSENDHYECTEKRQTIRIHRESCALCDFQETEVRTKTRKGCSGCNMVVCQRHWKDFEHNPDVYGEDQV